MFAESRIHTREVLFGGDFSPKICIIISHHHLLTIPILPAFCIFILSRPITTAHSSTPIKLMTVQHLQTNKCLGEASKSTDTSAREILYNKQGTLLFDEHYQLSAPMAFYEVHFPRQDVCKWKEIKYPLADHNHTLGIIRA